jgi:hypothetical protein
MNERPSLLLLPLLLQIKLIVLDSPADPACVSISHLYSILNSSVPSSASRPPASCCPYPCLLPCEEKFEIKNADSETSALLQISAPANVVVSFLLPTFNLQPSIFNLFLSSPLFSSPRFFPPYLSLSLFPPSSSLLIHSLQFCSHLVLPLIMLLSTFVIAAWGASITFASPLLGSLWAGNKNGHREDTSLPHLKSRDVDGASLDQLPKVGILVPISSLASFLIKPTVSPR